MVQPAFLRPGDRVGVLAPASRVDAAPLQSAFDRLESWGLRVEPGQTLTRHFHQFAGTDAERAAELQRMLDDPGLRAIFAARGGYGVTRILDRLDFTRFLQNPKWLVGFSDITALHAHVNRLGVQTIHGPMPKNFGLDPTGRSVETLRRALFGEPLRYELPPHPLNRSGVATGPLTGGNLCLLCHLLGTPSAVDTAGKILFLEDVGEYLYALDRYLVQLKRADKLARLAGLLVGRFSDTKDNPDSPYGFTPDEMVAEHVASYDYPVAYGFPVSHEADNWALVCGREARVEVSAHGAGLRA
jgi:muramoyltetrapeptide carboxypeptidase